ncbi:N,N-dimethylformamidase beta subunit family domain-containing protein [Phyllobacterium sophorae]|uniref:N,N-dimethylformamidase large subunit n=1 Tax=Phyllobacterium sophorae TaxID=1520277 RepID=A0A2P7BFM2_9HYPH|nr:N,N-dimethylformamidase beta subunit family domain-containing protein [Phyllobacterium sophorae]PSH65291.1 N,N-dimethylformamidase large subunit [Phyllobacterium sophorae]
MNAQKLPSLIGYVTPLSAEPGGTLEFKISSRDNRPVTARALRLICCDPNPDGPGMKIEEAEFGLAPRYAAFKQQAFLGSCAFGPIPALSDQAAVKVDLLVMPRLPSDFVQTLFSLQNADATEGVAMVTRDNKLFLRQLGTELSYEVGVGLTKDCWSRLEVAFDRDGVSVTVSQDPQKSGADAHSASVSYVTSRALAGVDHICFAALWRKHPEQSFNGSIENPSLSTRGVDATGKQERTWEVVASWDFGGDAREAWVADEKEPGRRLSLINMPTRAVRSSAWSGRNMDWKQAPLEYAAIAFHSDDLSDCGWQTTIQIDVPEGTRSGVYGLEIDNGDSKDTIPFYVIPGARTERQKIVFLVPTFTYLAYANFARGNFAGELVERVAAWNAYPHNPDEVGAYGYSTYSRHPDGSGITLSSRLRPILTMRPQYLIYFDSKGSGMRHFSADSHLTDWLEEKGFAFDVITDEDLDRDGLAALSPYDVVLTGTHPEYHTRRTVEALIAYREAGGNLMYLGGNGFYWKIGRHSDMPHLIEVRRAEGGMRVWASQPGEYYHQLDGEYGGLWRRNGIPPQMVAGVGFTAEGGFEGSYYVRTPASYRDDLAFLFEGISSSERIGDFGLSGGGAAGFEIDQAAGDLGTPDFATVVAFSEGHGPSFHTTFEELLLPGVFDGTPREYGGISSNIVYGRPKTGGGLFAVGSITFCGSLSHNDYNNNVSRLLENCLKKFLAND